MNYYCFFEPELEVFVDQTGLAVMKRCRVQESVKVEGSEMSAKRSKAMKRRFII